jgi:Type II secretion system protein B
MSLILDALKRAERERQDTENPLPVTETTFQDINRPEVLPEKNQFNWRWILLLLIVGSILIWAFLSKNSKVEAPVVQSINKPSDSVSSQVTVVSNSSVMHSSNNSHQEVRDLYQQSPSSLPKVQDVQVAQLYAENTAASSVSIEGQSVEMASVAVTNPLPDANEQLPKNLQTHSEARRIIDADAIAFDELSFNQKQLFPSISYSQHNYLGNSASSVVINGELLRVGSRITQDLSIEEIVEDGVIFNFYQKRVSFKALSGWINM